LLLIGVLSQPLFVFANPDYSSPCLTLWPCTCYSFPYRPPFPPLACSRNLLDCRELASEQGRQSPVKFRIEIRCQVGFSSPLESTPLQEDITIGVQATLQPRFITSAYDWTSIETSPPSCRRRLKTSRSKLDGVHSLWRCLLVDLNLFTLPPPLEIVHQLRHSWALLAGDHERIQVVEIGKEARTELARTMLLPQTI
jgi:hypothetical protein